MSTLRAKMDSKVTEQTDLSGRRGTSSGRKSITLPITRTDDSEAEPERDSDKLVYTSEGGSVANDTVKIVLSTLPPPPDTQDSVDSLGHTGTVSPLRMCPPRNIRALGWTWTRPGTVARQACPPGTVGVARWSCVPGNRAGDAQPSWSPASPDLSDCQSVWMEKIIRDLRKSELIINLANDLMQYVSVNALYGGDIKSAIDAMTIIAEKMQYQLRGIPTREQREAMVMELVQSLTKIGSHLVSDTNLAAWQDLPRDQQTRFLTNFISALERTGGLLPGVVEADQEVSVSSDNLRKLQITFLVPDPDLLISIFYIYLSPDHGHAPCFQNNLVFAAVTNSGYDFFLAQR